MLSSEGAKPAPVHQQPFAEQFVQQTSTTCSRSMFDMEKDMTVGLLKMWTRNAINVRRATMTTPTSYAKDLGNLLYLSAVVGGLSVVRSS